MSFSRRNNLWITVGISGSGKTFYSKFLTKNFDFVNVNNDDIRRSLFGIDHWDKYDFRLNEKLVTKIRKDIINRLIEDSRNIIVSNIHLTEKHLRYYKKLAEDNGYNFKIILLNTPLNVCLDRNRKRTEMRLRDERIVSQHIEFCKIYETILKEYDYEIIKWRE